MPLPEAPDATDPRAPSLRAAELLLRWPREVPLAALVSGGEERAQNAWSILARPSRAVVIEGHGDGEDPNANLSGKVLRMMFSYPV